MKNLKRVSVFILLILWMALIFFLSHETATESSDTSGGFSYVIASIIYPDFKDFTEAEKLEFIEKMTFPIRKSAHFTIFAIMGVLSLFNVRLYTWIPKEFRNVTAFIFSAFYAATDEFHQSFIDGRSCELRDWLIDCSGVLVGLFLINIFVFLKRGMDMRKKEIITYNQEIMADLQKQSDENEVLRKQLEEHKKVIESLNDRISDLQNMLTESENINCEVESEDSLKEEAVATQNNSLMDYGAVVIGKVILSAAEYAGRITSEEENVITEATDAIYSIAEEAKKDVLDIIYSDSSDDRKIQLMEREYQSAVNSFDRILNRL